jgi:putative transposase
MHRTDEDALTEAMIALAVEYGRYGYRRIAVKLQEAGWQVGKDRVQRIWRREGLKVPQKQRPRGRLWLNDGSCVRLRPERANHVWSYDFVSAMTHDGRTLRLLVLIDEYTRECLAIRVARRLRSYEVIETLADVMLWRGIPEHIRSVVQLVRFLYAPCMTRSDEVGAASKQSELISEACQRPSQDLFPSQSRLLTSGTSPICGV